MKKFISALSSFVIAATAMSGTMTLSTNAAVSETIVSLRSNGKDSVTVSAGDTVPVEVYIPQSSGFNSLQLKFAIGKDGKLEDYLEKRIFGGLTGEAVAPDGADVTGFETFTKRYVAALPAERAAIEAMKW